MILELEPQKVSGSRVPHFCTSMKLHFPSLGTLVSRNVESITAIFVSSDKRTQASHSHTDSL